MITVATFHHGLSSGMQPTIWDLIHHFNIPKEKISIYITAIDITNIQYGIQVDYSEEEWVKIATERSGYLTHCYYEFCDKCNAELSGIFGVCE